MYFEKSRYVYPPRRTYQQHNVSQSPDIDVIVKSNAFLFMNVFSFRY